MTAPLVGVCCMIPLIFVGAVVAVGVVWAIMRMEEPADPGAGPPA